MNDSIRGRISQWATPVEGIFAAVAESRATALPDFEWQQAFDDLLRLSRGGDCSYDRPSIGVQYALWYGMRRVEGAVRSLGPALLERPGDLSVVDLGCGCGAGAWAVALVEAARVAVGGAPRRVDVVAVDASPFMLDVARGLWSELEGWLRAQHPGVVVEVEWRLQSWTTVELASAAHRIAFGAYLFDWSDLERAGDLAVLADRLFDALAVDRVVLSGSQGKRKVIGTVTGTLEASGRWADAGGAARAWRTPVWSGTSASLGAARARLARAHALPEMGAARPTQAESATVFATLDRVAPAASLPLSGVAAQTRLVLDDEQAAAARLDGRMTAVLGAAGSGKSRVLIERAARSIERAARERRSHSVLVTTFNKALANQLAVWLDERLDASGRHFTRSLHRREHRITESTGLVTVRIMNWDKVPTRLFGVAPQGGELTELHIERWRRADPRFDDLVRRRPEIGTVEFLRDELRQVLYGLALYDRGRYLEAERTGRGERLPKADREVLHPLLLERSPRTFTHVRIDAHRRAVAERRPPDGGRFDLVVVDEYQDMTTADFEVMDALVAETSGLVVGGDPAQAIHLGKSARLPRPRGDRRWSRHHLEGSYRLPVRVCEAVAPIARAIQDARAAGPAPRVTADVAPLLSAAEIVLPHAVKNAALGVRPIVVAGTSREVADELREVLRWYTALVVRTDGSRLITVAEGDEWITSSLAGALPHGFELEASSMRVIKGLERPCVIWSTRALIPTGESHDEWIYTILTRTTCLAVLAISVDTPQPVAAVLRRLDADRLLFWSERAQRRFADVCATAPQAGGRDLGAASVV